MTRALLILGLMCFTEAANNVGSDITRALQNINVMETDLTRFYRQWEVLSRSIAWQGTKRALEICARDHKLLCTLEKKQDLSRCITSESKIIHDKVVEIYDEKITKPWKLEFQRLRDILEHPEQSASEIEHTIWTVHEETFSENSVRYRFYTSLVNFQLPNVAPDLYPLDKVYQLCLKKLLPMYM